MDPWRSEDAYLKFYATESYARRMGAVVQENAHDKQVQHVEEMINLTRTVGRVMRFDFLVPVFEHFTAVFSHNFALTCFTAQWMHTVQER